MGRARDEPPITRRTCMPQKTRKASLILERSQYETATINGTNQFQSIKFPTNANTFWKVIWNACLIGNLTLKSTTIINYWDCFKFWCLNEVIFTYSSRTYFYANTIWICFLTECFSFQVCLCHANHGHLLGDRSHAIGHHFPSSGCATSSFW